MSSMEISRPTYEKFRDMFAAGARFDGRKLDQYRELQVSLDVSNKAEGSARVKLGNTEVVVGVKLEVGTPYPDSLDKGNLMVSADLLPMASPRFEPGPPGFDAVELPRLVDRAIRESGMIDLKKLVVVEGEKVWTVIVDIYPINDDGNLIDAATIGAVVALKHSHLPGLKENNTPDYKHPTKTPVPLAADIAPFSFSFFKLGNAIVLDPTREEQEACDVRVTLGVSKKKGTYFINSCQKAGELPVSAEEFSTMASKLPELFENLNEKLKNCLKD